jgi:O6-methylguanine-DNA--protein-cysteine methyltransferase
MVFKTPLGWAGVAVSEQGVCEIILPKKEKKAVEKELHSARCVSPLTPALSPEGSGRTDILNKAVKLLEQYFSGERVSFDLPVDMRYYTAFQQAVWKAAAEIPFGEARSYGWIAKKIKNTKAGRAVGRAMGANPLPIIIP